MATSAQISAAQAAINAAGYTPALKVDGKMGPLTAAGISWYQTAKGVPATGALDAFGNMVPMVNTVPGIYSKVRSKVGAKSVTTATGAAIGAVGGPAGAGIGAAIGFSVGWLYDKIKGPSIPPATALPVHATPAAPVGAPVTANPANIVPVPSFARDPSMSNGDYIVSIVRNYGGDSLSNNRADLGALVARGVDDPNVVVTIQTNCAMFALGVLKAAGVQHPLLDKPYVNGMAFVWLVQIGTDLNAWRDPATDGDPPAGAAMWYRIAGSNDDHVEFMLTPPSEHGGGGRANNAVTIESGDIHTSVNRPLYKWLDPNALPMGG